MNVWMLLIALVAALFTTTSALNCYTGDEKATTTCNATVTFCVAEKVANEGSVNFSSNCDNNGICSDVGFSNDGSLYCCNTDQCNDAEIFNSTFLKKCWRRVTNHKDQSDVPIHEEYCGGETAFCLYSEFKLAQNLTITSHCDFGHICETKGLKTQLGPVEHNYNYTTYCCDTDLCNEAFEKNPLKCVSETMNFPDLESASIKEETCNRDVKYCAHLEVIGSNQVLKFCDDKLLCQSNGTVIKKKNEIEASLTCCDADFCNKGVSTRTLSFFLLFVVISMVSSL